MIAIEGVNIEIIENVENRLKSEKPEKGVL